LEPLSSTIKRKSEERMYVSSLKSCSYDQQQQQQQQELLRVLKQIGDKHHASIANVAW
jgi:hypothetical protein